MPRNLHKILHIDDDPAMRLMTKKALERSKHNYHVTSCVTPHEFFDCITELQPDLLLIDFVMPLMDGESLIEKIRQHPDAAVSTCPVVFISGKDHVSFRNRDRIEPVLGIIRKPFLPSELGQDLFDLWNQTQLG